MKPELAIDIIKSRLKRSYAGLKVPYKIKNDIPPNDIYYQQGCICAYEESLKILKQVTVN